MAIARYLLRRGKLFYISKSDWKLFRERIGEWQEANMERLNKEYVKLLTGDEPASKSSGRLRNELIRIEELREFSLCSKNLRLPGISHY